VRKEVPNFMPDVKALHTYYKTATDQELLKLRRTAASPRRPSGRSTRNRHGATSRPMRAKR